MNDDVEADAGGHLGPSSSVGGVGVGWEQSERGAMGAAMAYATATQSWLYLADEDVREAAETVTAERAQDRLLGPLVEDVGLLRDQLAGADGVVWYVVAPLAVRAESYTDSRAVISIWTVRMLSAQGVAVPQSGWQTVTLDLEWDGDWMVVDSTEREGPTPQLESGQLPWDSEYLEQELSGFVRVGAQ